jgi:hypothetical protein
MIKQVGTPKEAAEYIKGNKLPVELMIPLAVNTESFKQNIRRILGKRGIRVVLSDSKREAGKGILVTK